MTTQLVRRRFTTEEYHRMAQAGILTEDDRVELIDGEIVEMAPIGSRHAACVKRLNQLLSERLGRDVIVSVQDPIRLGTHSEPQPDIALLRPRSDYYASAHPRPEDVLLVVEVADTSAGYDRAVKLPLYARTGIREVWLVDLETNGVEMYRGPEGGTYREARRAGDVSAPEAFPDFGLAVAEVLGR